MVQYHSSLSFTWWKLLMIIIAGSCTLLIEATFVILPSREGNTGSYSNNNNNNNNINKYHLRYKNCKKKNIQLYENQNNNDEQSINEIVCIFGRPGAGKTTVANCVMKQWKEQQQQQQQESLDFNSNIHMIGIDLDVCIPQWMKDNFSKGIYPTLPEREQFAMEACDYVEKIFNNELESIKQQQQQQVEHEEEKNKKMKSYTTKEFHNNNNISYHSPIIVIGLISFSFVNTDLRTIFRQKFPKTKWILMNTNEIQATQRMEQRDGHFYHGKHVATTTTTTTSKNIIKEDNLDWQFAPVTFDHDILDGKQSIEYNAKRIIDIIQQQVLSQSKI